MTFLCVSDNDGDRLFVVDVAGMTVRWEVAVGSGPYPVDAIGRDEVLVSTRGLKSIQPVMVRSGKKRRPVPLTHTPRSTTRHPGRPLALVSGGDRSLTTILDTQKLQPLCVVGSGSADSRRDFGGSLACGHPAWGPNDTVLHLDRIARRVELYDLEGTLVHSANLPSSAHHVASVQGGYLLLCEGNPESRINPSVVKLRISDSRITVEAHRFLPIPPMHVAETGAHHLTYDSGRRVAYIGTNDGRVFTVATDDLRVLNVVGAGPGCGHVTVCDPNTNLAVATNHTGVSMTVLDLEIGKVAGSIVVSGPAHSWKKTQGHTSRWFANTGRLVTTAAQDGKVLEIDPETRTVTRSLTLAGAYLIQGCFV